MPAFSRLPAAFSRFGNAAGERYAVGRPHTRGMSRWGAPSSSYPTMNFLTVAERNSGG